MITFLFFYLMGIGSVVYFSEVMDSVLTFLNKKKDFKSKIDYYISYSTKDTRDLLLSEHSKTRDIIEDYMDDIRQSLLNIKSNNTFRPVSP